MSRTTSLDQVVQHLPPAQGPPPLEVQALAVVVCDATDCRLAGEAKVQEFRSRLQQYLQASLPNSPLHAACAEPWHAKDVFQLLCETMLIQDLAPLQRETVAILVQAILIFGRDAEAIIALLICMRGAHAWGRAAHAEETRWLAGACVKAIARSEEYLASEHAGELPLSSVVQGLV